MNYLFPHKYKKIGILILIPSIIIGLIVFLEEYEPSFMNFNLPAIFIEKILFYNLNQEEPLLKIVNNNILNEIMMTLTIISALFVPFSKEKTEDEYISRLRLKSLVWAVYVNYSILLLSSLLIFDLSFLLIMIFNMFTVLLFFIIRFNWQFYKFKKATNYEE